MAPNTVWEGREEPGLPVDTIVAVSTAPGRGAVAVVRVSGPHAFDVLDRVAPELPERPAARTATVARIREPVGPGDGEVVDRALVTCFPGPDSYTGEDVVEISGHGGWLAPALVVEACVAAGARGAEPGEFTRRAYLNGKVDLVQAEAVADLVEGRNRALHRAAVHQLERGLSARIGELRDRLVHLEALLVHHIDFPEEDEPPVAMERVVGEARKLAGGLDAFLATAPEGELLREGALAVLAGRPNSGKSSLFNALLGTERAIVTDRPGTTRDAIEASVSLGGFPFRLVDTAGLRDTDETVERMGVEVARRYLEGADVVLFCAEAGRALGPDERAFLEEIGAPVVEVRTKADRRAVATTRSGVPGRGAGAGREPRSGEGRSVGPGAEDGGGAGPSPVVEVSVRTGRGLGRLREALPALVFRGLVRMGDEAPVLTRERQRRAVVLAHRELEGFVRALSGGVPAEVAAAHLGTAGTALEEVLGVIGGDEVLDRVFRDFCIGK